MILKKLLTNSLVIGTSLVISCNCFAYNNRDSNDSSDSDDAFVNVLNTSSFPVTIDSLPDDGVWQAGLNRREYGGNLICLYGVPESGVQIVPSSRDITALSFRAPGDFWLKPGFPFSYGHYCRYTIKDYYGNTIGIKLAAPNLFLRSNVGAYNIDRKNITDLNFVLSDVVFPPTLLICNRYGPCE